MSIARPNIVMILMDDLGYGDLACFGHPSHQTPHFDALANSGARFTDFHSTGTVCSPTRAAIITGRYQQRCGIEGVVTTKNHRDVGLSTDELTFSKVLRESGYATGLIGKWHLGYDPRFHPHHHGFDYHRGFVSGNVDYFSHVDQAGYADWWENGEPVEEAGYTTDLITHHACQFIERHKDHPFCLYIQHEAPHYPYQGPHDGPERRVGEPLINNAGSREDRDVAYKEIIEALDGGIGKVMDTLERTGLRENTFVFVSSDHGATGPGSNAPLRAGKTTVYEGGTRVPTICSWPGKVEPGLVIDNTASCLDLFPTFLGLSGASVPEEHILDGQSLLPLLTHADSWNNDRTFFWRTDTQTAVRQERWKLVLSKTDDGFDELFDLEQDISEQHNRAEAELPRVARMKELLSAWEAEVSANVNRIA